MILQWKCGTTIHIIPLTIPHFGEPMPTAGHTAIHGTTITGVMIRSGAGDTIRTGAGTVTLGAGTEAGMIHGTAAGTTHGIRILTTAITTITTIGTILTTAISAAVPYITRNRATAITKAYPSAEVPAADSTAHATVRVTDALSQAMSLHAAAHLPVR